jgi:hypothetical protein
VSYQRPLAEQYSKFQANIDRQAEEDSLRHQSASPPLDIRVGPTHDF